MDPRVHTIIGSQSGSRVQRYGPKRSTIVRSLLLGLVCVVLGPAMGIVVLTRSWNDFGWFPIIDNTLGMAVSGLGSAVVFFSTMPAGLLVLWDSYQMARGKVLVEVSPDCVEIRTLHKRVVIPWHDITAVKTKDVGRSPGAYLVYNDLNGKQRSVAIPQVDGIAFTDLVTLLRRRALGMGDPLG